MIDPIRYYFDELPLHPPPARLESFTSYLTRLAQANGHKSIYEITWLTENSKGFHRLERSPDYPHPLCESIAQLVGCAENRLHRTSFLYLGRRFGSSIHTRSFHRFLGGSLSSSLRYCSRCLAQSASPYYSLIWRFLSVPGCAVHECALLDACGHCGAALPLFQARFPRMAICPRCQGDLRLCRVSPLLQDALQLSRKITRDLEWLLSPIEGVSIEENLAKVIGKRFASFRHQHGLSIEEVATLMGKDESIVLDIEMVYPFRRATFRDYMRYADLLGYALYEIIDVTDNEHLMNVSEEQVFERVEVAVKRLKAQDEPITRRRIASMVAIPVARLEQHPRVRSLLHRYRREWKGQAKRQREEGMIKQMEQTIQYLEMLGEPVMLQRVCSIIGVPYTVMTSRRAKARFVQVMCDLKEDKVQTWLLLQNELLKEVEQSFQQLERSNQPMTVRNICKIVGVPMKYLRQFPRIEMGLLQKDIALSKHGKQNALVQNDFIKLVEDAVKQLHNLGESLTIQRICDLTGLSRWQLRRNPQIAHLLKSAREEARIFTWQRKEEQRHKREEHLLELVKQAIIHLQLRAEPVSLRKVSQIVGYSARTLRSYPHIKTYFQKYQETNVCNQEYRRQYEDELIRRVQQVIVGLRMRGHPITLRSVCGELGWPQQRLERYGRVRALFKQYKGYQRFTRQSVEQQEQELLTQIEQAAQRLKGAGEPVLPRTVGMLIHFPFQRLDDFPRVRVRFQQMLDEYHQIQKHC